MARRSHIAGRRPAQGFPARAVVLALFAVAILCLGIAPQAALASDREPRVYFFWASGCPGCEEVKSFLDKARKDDPKIELRDFNVESSLGNAMLFDRIYELIGMPGFGALPLVIIGTHVVIGYDNEGGSEILNHIRDCRQRECRDIVETLLGELGEAEQASRCAQTSPAALGPAVATGCR